MKTLLDALERRAAVDADRHAYRFFVTGEVDSPRRTRTWQQVWSRATAVAHHLSEQGLTGQRALLLMGDGIDFIDAFFGCLLAGVVAVPVTPPDPSRLDRTLPRLRGIAGDCEATAIVTTSSIVRMAGALRDLAPDLHAMRWIVVDEIDKAEGSSWRRPEALGAASLAVLQYTSGSTGSPAGVRITHGNLWSYCDVAQQLYRMDRDTRVFTWLPLFHDMGLMGGIVVPTRVGNLYSWMSPTAFLRRPMRWPQILSAERITFTAGPDFSYALCARKADPEGVASLDLSPLRVAVNSAEPVRGTSIDAFARVFAPAGFRLDAMLPAYGLAEATLGITGFAVATEPRILSLDADALERGVVEETSVPSGSRSLVSCGHPASELELRIVDPHAGTALPERSVGEIWARGPTMSPGYWREREDGRPMLGRLAEEGGEAWLRTGDLGLLDRGELFVAGRIKDLIIIGGRNHHPHDIEHTVVGCHPCIRPGCVIASSLELHGQEQLLVVAELDLRQTPPAGRPELFEQVVAEIRGAVGEHHRVGPGCIVLLPARTIDKTSSGKLARSRCRRRVRDGAMEALHRWSLPAPGAPRPPRRPELSAWLLEHLSELSGVDCRVTPQIDTSFERLGLGSLSLVSLAGELEQRLDRAFDATLLYDHATPRALLAFLREDDRTGPPQSDRAGAQSPIAIIGMACRAPGGVTTPEQLWDLLEQGRDAVGPLPPTRDGHDAPQLDRVGGFLDRIDAFDAGFFGITPREADWLDPQQRLLLECSWEAIEDAALDATTLRGHDVGVVMGIAGTDYQQLALRDPERLETWSALGMSHAASVGRISHVLGFEGPNLAIDTACSSSLVAIHQACQAIRSGECSMALAGGVNLVCGPDGTRVMRTLGALSPTGRCRSFGADADGYVRSEGCGVLVLKPLAAALRDGDPIRAVIEGSAVNQDGASNGFTAPRGAAQRAVVRAAVAGAGRSPGDIEYVEAHGTGTPLGDPIEASALAAVFGPGRSTALLLGSIKSNIGHTEAAAGVLGLVKAALVVEHRLAPPSLHAAPANPRLQPLEGQVQVCSAAHRLEHGRAGVSSFGFSGTNAHVVLGRRPERGPSAPDKPAEAAGSPPLMPWLLSTRGPTMLAEHARGVASFLANDGREDRDLAWTLACGRRHLPARFAVLARSAKDAAVQLERRGQRPWPVRSTSGTVALVLTDDSAPSIVEPRLESWPTGVIQRLGPIVDALAQRLGDAAESFRGAIWTDECWRRPASFAWNMALAGWWVEAAGLRSSHVVGEGVGAIAARCLDGELSLSEAARLVLVETTPAAADAPGTEGAPGASGIAEALRAPLEAGVRTWLEIGLGDRGLMSAALEAGPDPVVVSSIAPLDTPPTEGLLHAAARLYERGVDLRWEALFADMPAPRRLGGLPLQPFERRRHWLPGRTRATGFTAAYYDALDTAVVDPTTTRLTFGPLTATPPGFSWLRTFLEPERRPDHVRVAQQAQQDLRRLLWRGLPERPKRVLDVGCGYGTDLIDLAWANPALVGRGLTLSEVQARRASEALERAGVSDRVDVRRGDSTMAPLDGPFDVVLGFEVVHHIQDKRSLFEHVGEHLDPDARWLLADFVATAPGTIEHPQTSSWFIDAQTWSELLADNQLHLDAAIDVSPGIARFLDDDDFDAVIASHPRLALHPELLASFEAYRGLGTVLARGDARYVLLHAVRRPDAHPSVLRAHNRRMLEMPTDWRTLDPAGPREPAGSFDPAGPLDSGEGRAAAPPTSEDPPALSVLSAVELERVVLRELTTLLEVDLEAADLDATWFELGVDSLLSIELQQRLSRALGSALGTSELTNVRGPRELIEALEHRSEPREPRNHERRQQLASLPDDFPNIHAPPATAEALRDPAQVLVTGGTGFVGAFVIGALLRRTHARIRVLVRADDIAQARERLLANLMRHAIVTPRDVAWSRLEVVVGDLGAPRLGLDATAWASLVDTTDGIFHVGARLSYVLGLEQLAAVNVAGTKTLLALAAEATRPCAFHFVSTLAVFESASPEQGVDENSPPLQPGRYILGYSESKAVAETAVLQAAAAGLPVTIHRPGLVGGSLEGGSWNGDDFTCRLLHSVVELGALPDLHLELDLIPVDVLADGVVALAQHAPALGRAWHHRSAHPMTLDVLQRWLARHGHQVERRPAAQWARQLETHADDRARAIRGLLPFFVERDAHGDQTGFERYARPLPGSSERTRAMLTELGVRLPPAVALMLTGRCGDGLQWLLPRPAGRR